MKTTAERAGNMLKIREKKEANNNNKNGLDAVYKLRYGLAGVNIFNIVLTNFLGLPRQPVPLPPHLIHILILDLIRFE